MINNPPDMFNAILVDDEEDVRAALQATVANTGRVNIVGQADSIPKAVKLIHKERPEVIFLDIEMPGDSGLNLLEFFDEESINFDIIFVTAYSEYAIPAFKLAAFDYLLKPVGKSELNATLDRLALKRKNHDSSKFKNTETTKLAISSITGTTFLDFDEMVYLEAASSYTKVYLSNGKNILASKTLQDFESKLSAQNKFFRIHRKYLINLNEVRNFNLKDGVFIELKNGIELPVSRYRKKSFEAYLEQFKV